jgi:hypothetical protein
MIVIVVVIIIIVIIIIITIITTTHMLLLVERRREPRLRLLHQLARQSQLIIGTQTDLLHIRLASLQSLEQ